MKILLISVNRERCLSPVFPSGFGLHRQGIERRRPSDRGDGSLFFSRCLGRLKHSSSTFQPDLIGISLRNLDNLTYPTSISYLKEVEEVIADLSSILLIEIGHWRLRIFLGSQRTSSSISMLILGLWEKEKRSSSNW